MRLVLSYCKRVPDKVTAIMNKETSSKDEREAQLKAAEDEYNTKIRALQAQARTAARDGDALAAQQQQSAKAASADVTAASGDVTVSVYWTWGWRGAGRGRCGWVLNHY